MDDESAKNCARCGHPLVFTDLELDDESLALGYELSQEQLRRDWMFIEDLEELLYGEPLVVHEPVDPELAEIVEELDEEFPWKPRPLPMPPRPERDVLRRALYVLGWRHLPLRTAVTGEGQRRELWVRRMTVQEVEVHWDNPVRQEHPLTVLLAEYLGRREARRQRYREGELARTRMRMILQHLDDVGRPQWVGQIAGALGIRKATATVLMSFLYGEGEVARYTFNRGKTDAVYVSKKHAHRFDHIPRDELLPIDDLDEMDLYEQLENVLEGHTAIKEATLFQQFPNVQSSLLERVMDQFGWRSRRIQRETFWVSHEHPQWESRRPVVREHDRRVLEKRAAYAAAADLVKELDDPRFEDRGLEDVDLTPDDETAAVVDAIDSSLQDAKPKKAKRAKRTRKKAKSKKTKNLNGEAVEVMTVLRNGGTFQAREVAKATSLSTRRVTVVLDELVEDGKVMCFPVGSSQIYVAR